MPLDPSIPLSVKQFSIGQMAQDANSLLELQQNRQAVQAQNELRKVFSDPTSVDATGSPTPNALNKIMAIDPKTGMALRQNMLKTQQQQLQTQALQTETYGKKQDIIAGVRDSALSTYEQAKQAGMPDEQAREAAQRVLNEGLEETGKSGLFSDQEKQTFTTKFDPQTFRSRALDYKTWKQLQEKQRTDATAAAKEAETERHNRVTEDRLADAAATRDPTANKWDVRQDKDGTEYRYNASTAQATTLEGKPYTIKGSAGKVGAVKEGTPQEQALAKFKEEHKDDNDGKGPTAEQIAKFNQSNRAAPRSAPAMAVAKYMEEHPQATADDITNFAADYRARGNAVAAFSTGKEGAILRSFNVASAHLDTLDNLATALHNKDERTFNKIANAFSLEFGGTAPGNFETAKQVVGAELIKAVVGAGGTGADREKAQAVLDKANSPEQLKEAVQTIRELVKGQLTGLRQQYVDTTGKTVDDFNKRLSGAAARALGVTGKEDAADLSKLSDDELKKKLGL